MAKKKAKKLGLFGIILLLASIVGLVLAVVGIFIDFFTVSLAGESAGVALFEEGLGDGDIPIALVQAFAIAAVVLAAIACIVTVLGTFGIVKVGGLAKFLAAALVIVVAVLVVVFAATWAASFVPKGGDGILGDIIGGIVDAAGYSYTAGAGAYLVTVGGVLSGASMLLAKLK